MDATSGLTSAAQSKAIQQVHNLVERVEAAIVFGAYRDALKAAEDLIATLRPLAQ